jgi:peroxiredoxin
MTVNLKWLTKSLNSVLVVLSGQEESVPTAAEASPLPEYARAVAQMQAAPGKPALDDADRRTMTEAAGALAARMPQPGLKVGERAPDFVLPDAFGTPVSLADSLKQGPVIVTFYRGAWCPFCNLQLRLYQQSLPAFRRYRAALIAITPQRPEKSRGQLEQNHYEFAILSDLDDSVMKSYRLFYEVAADLRDVYKRNFKLELADYNGKDRYVLPVPGTFVVDPQGIVRAAFADTDYTRRMEPATIIAALQGIQAEQRRSPRTTSRRRGG